MTAFELSIATAEIGRRLMTTLRAGGATADVVWQNGTRRLMVHTSSVVARAVEGWLLVNLDCETDQTKRCTLQFVYYLGKRAEGNGIEAACTINAATVEASQIADGWGRDLQRVIWDTVLDGVEACVARMATQLGTTQPVTLGGFFTDGTSLIVSILAGV
jgi:hypothetical protein